MNTTFNSSQSNGLISVCILKKTGYEPALAESLGWSAIDARLYDAVKADGSKVEFKKQTAQQWFDMVKLSECTETDMNIEILWFMHDGGKVQSVHRCTYGELIASMGISKVQLRATRIFTRLLKALPIQIKFPINKRMIKSFPLVWER